MPGGLLSDALAICSGRLRGHIRDQLVFVAEQLLRGRLHAISRRSIDHGRRRATSDIAIAQYDGTVAAYRQTTLTAFQQVEDNLNALHNLEIEARQQHDATASAQQSLDLFNTRYEGGVDTYLQVITWQTALLQNQRNDIEIMQRRFEASVLLVKALGGGWDASQLPQQP